MARISYVAPETIADPQIRQWLEASIKAGRPGPENQAIRAHQPDVMRSFTTTFDMLFKKDKGTVEWELKELLRAYIAISMSCNY
ncbi:MAG: hypothetical protein LAN61_09775 [Acidobacteriia bacterium]|nr:hypothetical protein [Terriglobia bacterium]